MKELYVVNCCRTAVGSFGGSLKNTPAAQLGSIVVKEALKRANVAPENVDELMFGCILTAGLGQNVARQVGVGAVVYFDLHNDRNKDIDFRWERALNFDGETGPYVQYTHARCCSVLRKAEAFAAAEPDYSVITDDEAQDVLMLISHFPQVIRKAMEQSEPSLITRHTTQLAQAYNKYYFEHRIMDESDPAGTAARVNLTRAVRDVIKTGLYLIGVEAPERM